MVKSLGEIYFSNSNSKLKDFQLIDPSIWAGGNENGDVYAQTSLINPIIPEFESLTIGTRW